MDMKTLLSNLSEEVRCSWCSNTFTDPKQLPCLHSFCLHCLNEILRTSDRHNIITCPECRRESRIPGSGNLSHLPTNARLASLLDVLDIRDCNVKCGNCDKESSNCSYCFQCCKFWCEADCIRHHAGIKENRQHRVLALKDFRDEDFENYLKRPEFCRKPGHEKKELEFFCKECKDAICSSCGVTVHDGHAKTSLEEAANERTLQVKFKIESRKENIQKKRGKIIKLDENCAKIQEKAKNAKKSAEEFANEVIAVMKAKKQKFCEEVDSGTEAALQRLEVTKAEIEDEIKMTETAIEETEKLLTQSTKADIMRPNKFPDKIFQEELHQYDLDHWDDGTFPNFHFLENKRLSDIVSTEGIGSLETERHQSNTDGKGNSEAIVGGEGQFGLTTRTTGEHRYGDSDCVTSEIRYSGGDACETKGPDQDDNGNFTISHFVKEMRKMRKMRKMR